MTTKRPPSAKHELLDLVKRLREYMVSAPPEYPVHPKICDEAADMLSSLANWSDHHDH